MFSYRIIKSALWVGLIFFCFVSVTRDAGIVKVFAHKIEVNTNSQAVNPTRCEVLVRLQAGRSIDDERTWLVKAGLEPIKYLTQINVWRVACGQAENQDVARDVSYSVADHLRKSGFVQWAEPNDWASGTEIVPDDSFYLTQQPNFPQIGLPQAWMYSTGDTRPLAIIDTAIDLNHPDLKDKFWINRDEIPNNQIDDDANGYVDDINGWDFYDMDPDPDIDPGLDSSHGTHVAGIAAANSNNQQGVAGVSWKSPVMVLRALGPDAIGRYSAVAEALLYAADNDAQVLNLSLGGVDFSQTLSAAVQYVAQHDCLMVASAGNESDAVLYPAAFPEVIAVSAVDVNDLPAYYSSSGPQVELAAPGDRIFSTVNFSYGVQSGTSQAAPHVSGVAALVWSLRPTWTAAHIRQVLDSTAHDVWIRGRDELTGFGRIDALAAVKAANPLRLHYFPFFPNNFLPR
jgi:thermitase